MINDTAISELLFNYANIIVYIFYFFLSLNNLQLSNIIPILVLRLRVASETSVRE
jgi:hypothetical protein